MRPRKLAIAVLVSASVLVQGGCVPHINKASPEVVSAGPSGIMKWSELLTRSKPMPNATLAYGADATQVVDIWLPALRGPHPTVIMVHGGCWTTEIADRTIMNWISDDLRKRGIAVWNIDYRGVDRPGGGYPGTFNDASAAADLLRANTARYNLDVKRLTAVGHSAGGHIALWLAGRHRLAKASVLRSQRPMPIRTVISLGGLPDLEQAAKPPGSGCGMEVIPKISGGRYAETSVPRLAPLGVRQVLINGLQDKIIPVAFAADYASAMRSKGDRVVVRMIDQSGHVELIAPETQAWRTAVHEINSALGR